MTILDRLHRRIEECKVTYGKSPNEKVAYTDDAKLLIEARDTIAADIRELGRLRQDNLRLVEILARRPCPRCDGLRWMCERHPRQPWDDDHAGGCGGAGIPCPICNNKVPPDLPPGSTIICSREGTAQ